MTYSAEVQKTFLNDYDQLKENQQKNDVILFMDAVHPKHNPVMACGWIKKGKDFQICSNSGRQRLNINGAVSLDTMKLDMRYDNPKDHIASLRSLLTENFSDN